MYFDDYLFYVYVCEMKRMIRMYWYFVCICMQTNDSDQNYCIKLFIRSITHTIFFSLRFITYYYRNHIILVIVFVSILCINISQTEWICAAEKLIEKYLFHLSTNKLRQQKSNYTKTVHRKSPVNQIKRKKIIFLSGNKVKLKLLSTSTHHKTNRAGKMFG